MLVVGFRLMTGMPVENCEGEWARETVFAVYDLIEQGELYGEEGSVSTKLCSKGSGVEIGRGLSGTPFQ
jgi:hypothetical protein